MPFLPFLQMTPTSPRAVRPGIDVDENGYALPKNALPLPPPVAPIQNNDVLDSNLIAQLEAAQYGQSVPPPPMKITEDPAQSPAQTTTQQQLNIQSQEPGRLPQQLPPEPKLTNLEELALSYGQSQEMQNQAIKQAEEQLAAARAAPQQMDLSPLIALSQSWSERPSNLLQAYQRPTDKSKTIQALQEAVLKARGGAAELARMRSKDVNQLSLQERQMLINEDLKRAQIAAMKTGKENKDTMAERKLVRADQEAYTKDYGKKFKALSMFTDKVSRLRNFLISKGKVPSELFGKDRGEYEQLVDQITTAYNRDIAELGALAGADLVLLRTSIGQDPSAVVGRIKALLTGSQASVNALDNLLSDSRKMFGMASEELRGKAMYENTYNLYDKDKEIFDNSFNEKKKEENQSAKKYTEEELVNLQKTNPEEFERYYQKVVGGK